MAPRLLLCCAIAMAYKGDTLAMDTRAAAHMLGGGAAALEPGRQVVVPVDGVEPAIL